MNCKKDFVLTNNIYEVDNFIKKLGILIQDYLSAEEMMKFSLGIAEIIINAIEHGNLEIDYDQKSIFMKDGVYFDELRKRAENNRYKDRRIYISLKADMTKIELVIRDCGCGFDWRKYFNNENRNILDTHGRGLQIAKFYLDEISFNECGNEVKVLKIPTGKKCLRSN